MRWVQSLFILVSAVILWGSSGVCAPPKTPPDPVTISSVSQWNQFIVPISIPPLSEGEKGRITIADQSVPIHEVRYHYSLYLPYIELIGQNLQLRIRFYVSPLTPGMYNPPEFSAELSGALPIIPIPTQETKRPFFHMTFLQTHYNLETGSKRIVLHGTFLCIVSTPRNPAISISGFF
jgi:hypothetical protein